MQSARLLEKSTNLLYPLMLIAAVTVIVFSLVGIATMLGWLPSARSGSDRVSRSEAVVEGTRAPATARPATADVLNNKVFYRACLNCHVAIHGSNHPSGKTLLR